MNNSFESFIGLIQSEAQKANSGVTTDLVHLAKDLGEHVGLFLTENNIARIKGNNGVAVANETFGLESLASIGYESIEKLVEQAKVPECHRPQAIEGIAIILGRNACEGDASNAWANQTSRGEDFSPSRNVVSMEQLFPGRIGREFSGETAPAMESFGVGTDKALSDMKVAIAISLMKWHTTLTPRILAVRGTAQSNVTYVKETIEVYDLDDTDTETTTSLIDLYEDPSLVKNELKTIVPLTANDAGSVLVADGVVKFGVDANLLKLSIDGAKYGYTKINRTDIVADNVKLDVVQVTLADGTDTEVFAIQIPATRGRLTRLSNGETSDRAADIKYRAVLVPTTLTAAGASSAILAKLGDAKDAVVLDLNIKPSIDLRTGIANALGSYTIAAGNVDNLTPDAATDAEIALLVANKAELTGYALEAKFSEENMRKTNIAATTYRSSLSYDIPTGKNYVMDYALGDGRINASQNVANLNNVIRIGQDARVLDVVETTMTQILDEIAAYAADPDNKQNEPGRYFAAGGKVRPTVIQGTLDLTGITTDRDDVRFDVIKQRTLSFLTSVIAEIHAKSFFVQQLVAGMNPTYRVITSNEVMANVLGIPHTHDHLNSGQMQNPGDGVELKLVLPNATVLEVITTTFAAYSTKMLIVPKLQGQPDSELNFGHNWDYGTMVGHYSHTGEGAANQRLFANCRELPVPTNVIGAIIDVNGLDEATFRV